MLSSVARNAFRRPVSCGRNVKNSRFDYIFVSFDINSSKRVPGKFVALLSAIISC